MQRTRKIAPAGTPTDYNPASLTEPAERRLHDVITKARDQTTHLWELTPFVDAALDLAGTVAEFFEQVLVMANDPTTRATRLALLASVAELGGRVLNWDTTGT